MSHIEEDHEKIDGGCGCIELAELLAEQRAEAD